MSEELQRLIGALMARVDALEKKVARSESAWIIVGASAVGVVVAFLLKQAGII